MGTSAHRRHRRQRATRIAAVNAQHRAIIRAAEEAAEAARIATIVVDGEWRGVELNEVDPDHQFAAARGIRLSQRDWQRGATRGREVHWRYRGQVLTRGGDGSLGGALDEMRRLRRWVERVDAEGK